MTCYAISGTEKSVRTACEKWLRRGADYTTAADRVTCPDCYDSSAWDERQGRFGIGDHTVQVHEEIAMQPQERGSRFRTRKQKSLPGGPVKG